MKWDDAELLARINRGRDTRRWYRRYAADTEDWGFDWLTAVLGLVVLIIITVMMMLPQPKAHTTCPAVQGVVTSTETGR